jgi:hypothetical protein
MDNRRDPQHPRHRELMLSCCTYDRHDPQFFAVGDKLTLTGLQNLRVEVSQVYLGDRGEWQVVVKNAITGHDVGREEQHALIRCSTNIVRPRFLQTEAPAVPSRIPTT